MMNRFLGVKRTLAAGGAVLALLLVCWSPPVLAVEPKQRDYWPTKAWEISTPQSEGMNEAKLLRAIPHLIKHNYDIRSLLVVKNGYLVFENYYAQGMPDRPATVHSVSKSIMSTLIGTAHHQGILPDLDASLAKLLPGYFQGGKHPDKARITLRNLLTMTTGLKPVVTKHYRRFYRWYVSKDRVRFFLEMPVLHQPGRKFAYCNATSHMLSVILSKAAGMSTEDFAQKHLFDPLGIKPFFWNRDAKGYCTGNGGIHLTARQMAKFGFLFLNQGEWDGRQVVPRQWVEQATKAQVRASGNFRYGYQWWIHPAAGRESYRAWGHGGQYIVVVPELDLVIVTTANTKIRPGSSSNFSAMFDLIAGAVEK